jgi:hypothetical protein
VRRNPGQERRSNPGVPPQIDADKCRWKKAFIGGLFRQAQAAPATFGYDQADVTMKCYTEKKGQYLAFIFYYTKIHGVAPSEADMRNYFKVSPPSVHQIVVTLEANRFIDRIPGQGRSIRLLIPREELPELQ